jgi:hypothetical protein
MAISPELARIRGLEATARANAEAAGAAAADTEATREINAHEAARIAAATAEGREAGYRRGLQANRDRLNARAEALGVEPQGWFRRLGAGYNSMKWYNKLLLTGGLIGGAVTFGSLVPMLAIAAKAGLVGQRFAGFSGMFYKAEKSMENSRAGTFFARRSNGERAVMAAAFAGLYTFGASKVIGAALNYAGESSWAHTATDWLRAHWPIKSGMFSAAPAAAASSVETTPAHIDSAYLNSSSGGPEYTTPGPDFVGPPEPHIGAEGLTRAENYARLDSLLRSDHFNLDVTTPEAPITEGAAMSTVPPEVAGITPTDAQSTLEGSITFPTPHDGLAIDFPEPAHPEPFIPEAHPTVSPVPHGLEVLHPPSLADTMAPPESAVSINQILHPEPLVAVDAHPFTSVPEAPDPADMSFAEFQATHPAPEIPTITADASTGHGYEFMTKRLWEQLQDKHLDAAKYPQGSDLRALIEAKPTNIDEVVHDIATKHGFFHVDGTSTLVDPKAHVSFNSAGEVHFGDPAHHLDVVESPEGAPVTPPYHPEVAHAEAPVTNDYDAYNSEQPPTHVQQWNPDLPPEQPYQDLSQAETSPDAPTYSEASFGAPIVEDIQVNTYNVPVDVTHANAYLGDHGQHIVFGGTAEARKALAKSLVERDHTDVYFESTKRGGLLWTKEIRHFSKAAWADGAPKIVDDTVDATLRGPVPNIDDLREVYNPN